MADGRWALLAKVHHCAVDGVGGIGLLVALFGEGADAARNTRPGFRDARTAASGPPPVTSRTGSGRPSPRPSARRRPDRAVTGRAWRVWPPACTIVPHDVACLMPVSVRGPGDDAGRANRISAVLLDLPCAEPDPKAAAQTIRRRTADLKDTRQARTGQLLLDLIGRSPVLLPVAVRLGLSFARPVLRTVVTNVPGPSGSLRLLGRDVHAVHPYVPIGASVETSIAVVSYRGRLHFGVTGLRGPGPGVAELARGIASAWGTVTDRRSRTVDQNADDRGC
ncbi:WS/DGAT domain-containing protein [Actinocorallia aurea]